jgi:LPS-assembly protein
MKIAPNNTKNYKDDENKINVNNIYSLNRINKNDTLEGGLSLTYGADYNLINKNQNEILSFKIANNLRINDNPDISHVNQLNQKTSNFFTETYFKPTNFLDVRYDASIKNNLSEIASENIVADLKFKNFEISFDYLNENNTKDKNSFLSNTVSYNIDNSNSIMFKTRENKIDDFTEFYKLIYQYNNDCLSASIEYDKEYYNDKDLNSEETIFFKLSLSN